ncbi:hypothetical protein [Nonomuraea aridisoli]|uniref:hypothetical protein n=1 Tax=Nonomuraea aridisoli TaxID=2070368 RepID=UPI0015E8C4DF|nr:hypothetical protein [Nonomuraea aridisoli]
MPAQDGASCHPLADPEEADRLVTDHATSADGLHWTWHRAERPSGTVGRTASASARLRFDRGRVPAFYDGRASAAEN